MVHTDWRLSGTRRRSTPRRPCAEAERIGPLLQHLPGAQLSALFFAIVQSGVESVMPREYDPFYDSQRWKRARAAALLRDGYQCRECRRYGRTRQADIVHHVQHVEDRPDLAYRLDNLVSLCRECHNKQHPEKGGRHGPGRGGSA